MSEQTNEIRRGIVVREAKLEDVGQILDLWVELQRINSEYDSRLTMTAEARLWMQEFLLTHLGEEHCIVFVASDGDGVVGYVFGQILMRPTLASLNAGYIADISVHSEHRGKGIGRRLYVRITSWFLEHNIKSVEVQVIRNNPGSQAFWRKMGFSDFLRTLHKNI